MPRFNLVSRLRNFRIHLSTAVCIMLASGALLGANLRPYQHESVTGNAYGFPFPMYGDWKPQHITLKSGTYNSIILWERRYFITPFGFMIEVPLNFRVPPACLNLLIFASSIFLVGFMSERWICTSSRSKRAQD